MDFEKFMTQLSAANQKTTEAEVARATAEGVVTTLTADRDAQAALVASLTTERDELQAQIEAGAGETDATTKLAAMKEYVGKHYVALKTLDGDNAAAVLEDVDAMIAYIDENEVRLSALIPVGGVAAGAGAGEGNESAEQKAQDEAIRLTADAYRSNK